MQRTLSIDFYIAEVDEIAEAAELELEEAEF